MSERPLIALFPSHDEEEHTQTVYLRYVRAVVRAGCAPFVLPMTDDAGVMKRMAALCDGALFTGGEDIDPRFYGSCLHEGCGKLTPLRDSCEFAFAAEFLKTKKPYLGICRGMQFLNIFYGGTLYQDIATEYSRSSQHHQSPPYNAAFHGVRLEKGGALEAICGLDRLSVNSMHHQAVKKLGAGLIAEGFADDGIMEALSASDRPYGIAVQWHPEHLVEKGDSASLALFDSFAEAAREYMRLSGREA